MNKHYHFYEGSGVDTESFYIQSGLAHDGLILLTLHIHFIYTRDRQRERERQTDRHTDRERERETNRQTDMLASTLFTLYKQSELKTM